MPDLKYHDGSSYKSILQKLGDYSLSVKGEVLTGTVNGTNAVFTVSREFQLKTAPDSHAIAIFKNGVRMKQGDDYTINALRQITFTTPPAAGSTLVADYDTISSYAITGAASPQWKRPVTGTKNGVNTTFQVAGGYQPGTLQVYVNGLMQGNLVNEIIPASGAFTLDQAPLSTDIVEATYLTNVSQSGNADTVDGFHAGNGPGQMPVLDSNGKLPISLQQPVSRKINTTTSTITSPRIEVGVGYMTNGGSSSVTFTTPFNSVPIVIVTPAGGSGSSSTFAYPGGNGFTDRSIGTYAQSNTGFSAQLGGTGPSSSQHVVYTWIAIGD